MKAAVATREAWAGRVEAWKASGQSARDFSLKTGVSSSSLYQWAKRLERKSPPRFLKLVPRASSPLAAGEMIVEVGSARVRVPRGFDAELLADVVKALSKGER